MWILIVLIRGLLYRGAVAWGRRNMSTLHARTNSTFAIYHRALLSTYLLLQFGEALAIFTLLARTVLEQIINRYSYILLKALIRKINVLGIDLQFTCYSHKKFFFKIFNIFRLVTKSMKALVHPLGRYSRKMYAILFLQFC